jgi:hypothetical protein
MVKLSCGRHQKLRAALARITKKVIKAKKKKK